MAGSQYGKIFHISTFGESHGKALGVVVDGCPAGLSLSEEDIQEMLERRRPGKNLKMTQRKEGDKVEILSGIFEGKTTGTPIAMVVWNEDQRSKDYGEIAHAFRPGHGDYGFFAKYGFRDYRGGGRSSGRETIARVAAGAIAKKMLLELGVSVRAKVIELAGISLTEDRQKAELLAEQKILSLREQGDSAGGVVECLVEDLPAGIGEPVFDKLDASLAKAVMSIGAVKSVEIGDGIEVSKSLGSENNDAFFLEENDSPSFEGSLRKGSNHSGGILGGMSDGSTIRIRAGFKPTPSISKPQQTVNEAGEEITIAIKGRHDPTVVERANVVVEAMTALTVLDAMLENLSARLDYVKRAYRR
ncbi:chorismate synthase [uncultured Oribacterium sp.]|uniref:chorismate synthase n=1 Tax=uncultured Oribacterium sp. TaxID=462198 RepID=UPI002806381E|nr:chorismate synthase [uncultured Oribacterium sp.]